MSTSPVKQFFALARSSSPPPPVSQDLWTETGDKKTKLALRSVSDEIICQAAWSIKTGLPNKIIELSDLIHRSQNDESSMFHPKWDTRWTPSYSMATPTLNSFAVLGISSTNVSGIVNGDAEQTSHTTTNTRRFSLSQQFGPSELALPSCISVYKTPIHTLQLWEVLIGHVQHIVELLDLVQVYLILKTPIAEEGNNTGVEIQNQCSRTLVDARRFVVGCQTYLKLYHTQRAKLASKCIKYPQLEDYQRALVERDYEECRDCRYLLMRLRVQCIAVVDGLHKNFEKVDDPKGLARGGGTVGMY